MLALLTSHVIYVSAALPSISNLYNANACSSCRQTTLLRHGIGASYYQKIHFLPMQHSGHIRISTFCTFQPYFEPLVSMGNQLKIHLSIIQYLPIISIIDTKWHYLTRSIPLLSRSILPGVHDLVANPNWHSSYTSYSCYVATRITLNTPDIATIFSYYLTDLDDIHALFACIISLSSILERNNWHLFRFQRTFLTIYVVIPLSA